MPDTSRTINTINENIAITINSIGNFIDNINNPIFIIIDHEDIVVVVLSASSVILLN